MNTNEYFLKGFFKRADEIIKSGNVADLAHLNTKDVQSLSERIKKTMQSMIANKKSKQLEIFKQHAHPTSPRVAAA
jgi:hypothetical protein